MGHAGEARPAVSGGRTPPRPATTRTAAATTAPRPTIMATPERSTATRTPPTSPTANRYWPLTTHHWRSRRRPARHTGRRGRRGGARRGRDFLAAGFDHTQAEHVLGQLRSSRPVYNMARSPAAVGGRLGGSAHRAKVRQVAGELERRGWTIVHGGGGGTRKEEFLEVAGGTRSRFPDITARKGGRILRIQVGRRTKGGLPVSRERRALRDIRGVQDAGDHTIFIEWE